MTVSAPVAGKFFVTGRANARLFCGTSSSNCQQSFAIYVDGQPVPGTRQDINGVGASSSSTPSFEGQISTFGVSGPIADGQHTVVLREARGPNVVADTSSSQQAVGAILIGS